MCKVAVAMSGGVDSSVTAAILKQQGYDVIGVTMQVLPLNHGYTDVSVNARQIAETLGVPFHTLDLREVFDQKVVADFCGEYNQGRTPNPCVRCNYYVKFGALLEQSLRLGAEYLATGHYAQIEKKGNRYSLQKGTDATKDQSYFLYKLNQDQLRQVLMPLGSYTKKQVRQIAIEIGLPSAENDESQEVCFVPNDDYRGFVATRTEQAFKPGPILNKHGKVLGEHRGIINYTIGQRRGIGIATGEPLYVVAIDARGNSITVGSKDDIYQSELIAKEVNWAAIEKPVKPIEVEAKIRYQHNAATARLSPLTDNRVRVNFERPQMAITPGQAVVFYQDDVVIGGGTIE